MKRRALLRKLSRREYNNVAFADMLHLMEGFGFKVERIRGSHHILLHPRVPVPVNLQEVKGEAKPYQIRQALGVVERYNLQLEEGD